MKKIRNNIHDHLTTGRRFGRVYTVLKRKGDTIHEFLDGKPIPEDGIQPEKMPSRESSNDYYPSTPERRDK